MSEKKRILVVDDDDGITRAVRLFLEATDRYEARAVNDSRRVVDTAEEFQPDLVILDVVMPQVDGAEVAARLKAHPRLGSVPIVFLTALVRDVEMGGRPGKTIGGHPFLAKPVEPTDLVALLDKLLGA